MEQENEAPQNDERHRRLKLVLEYYLCQQKNALSSVLEQPHGTVNVPDLIKIQDVVELLSRERSAAAKIKAIVSALYNSQILRTRKDKKAGEYKVLRRNTKKSSEAVPTNLPQTLYIDGLAGVTYDQFKQWASSKNLNILNLHYQPDLKETWAFVETDNPAQFLGFNGSRPDNFSKNLRIMTYWEWMAHKQRYRELRKKLLAVFQAL